MFEELLRGRKERERNVSCVTNTHGLQKKMVSRKQRDEILLRSRRNGGGENQRMFHGKNNGGSEKQTRKERQKESQEEVSLKRKKRKNNLQLHHHQAEKSVTEKKGSWITLHDSKEIKDHLEKRARKREREKWTQKDRLQSPGMR